jgi:hypothetical protein
MLGSDTPATVNVARLRAAPPLPKHWLRAGLVRFPLFRLPGLDAVVDAYTRVRLLNQLPGESLRLVERPTALGVHRALHLEPAAPPPAAFAALLSRIFRRFAVHGCSVPPGSLVIDLTWDGCTLARTQGQTEADVETAVVAVFTGVKDNNVAGLGNQLQELLEDHRVTYKISERVGRLQEWYRR